MKVSVGIPDLKNGIILVVTVTGRGDNPSGFKHFSTFGRKMDGLDLPPGPQHAIVANESVGWLGSLLVVTGWVYPRDATKKTLLYFPLYWLVNRDPYNGLL